ncbi:hypothetical protein MmiAt1_17620 [Methanimicrococcus sp. At1]|uniref:PIN domain-containing protein n=1 Tax=Methanimicrococcus hacksteinii TaxID=3028293 RepID=A0ABU3VRW8_9EURY|nr:PIN domain-containing protein [Methanimicrococcus sp. At1]MDV0446145.1 hypothetical protein [Methanimicrococcus sp. At1]
MIFDISSAVAIDPSEDFFVDTNVLYIVYFEKSEKTEISKKIDAYTEFLQKLKQNGNKLYISSLNLQEVLHVIEKEEYKDYCRQKRLRIKWKTYRKNILERQRIKKKLLNAVQQINFNFSITEDSVFCLNILQFVQTFEKHQLDPIDFLVVYPKCLTANKSNKNFNYITDDSDFKNDSRFQSSVFMNIYTYEKNENEEKQTG